MPYVLAMAFMLVVFSAVLLVVLTRLVLLCGPQELLVIAGRRRRDAAGRVVGYRVVTAGRALLIPFLERGSRLDLEPVVVKLSLADDGARPTLQGQAIVRPAVDPDDIDLTLQCLLGLSRPKVTTMARLVTEGRISDSLAYLTREQLTQRLADFEKEVQVEICSGLSKLGLELVSLELDLR